MDFGDVVVALYGNAVEVAPHVWAAAQAKAAAAASTGVTVGWCALAAIALGFVCGLLGECWRSDGFGGLGIFLVVVGIILSLVWLCMLSTILCPEYAAIEYAKQAFRPW